MSSEINYVTATGLEKLKKELKYLKIEGRAKIAKAIAEAREKGDLSENAEYDAAKEAQGHHEAKIAKLEIMLTQSRVMDESNIDPSIITTLSIVKIKNINTDDVMTYQLVSEAEADMKNRKISIKSPIAKGLMGKKEKDQVEINVPNGTLKFEVLKVSRT